MSSAGVRASVGLVCLAALIAGAATIVGRAGDIGAPLRRLPPADRETPQGSERDPLSEALTLSGCFEAPAGLASQRPAPTARAEIGRIERAVERLRGLTFRRQLDVTFTSPARLARKATRISLREYTRELARLETRLLEALGAIPRGTDLRATVAGLIRDQVAGFYLPSTGELVVPGDPGRPLGALDRTILAHEIEHALADQVLDLPLDDPDPTRIDENTATLSLVEGDATVTMQRYSIAAVSALDSLGMLGDPRLARSQESLARTPHYLIRQLSFPYDEGMRFVCHLLRRGGWRAVDRAYRDPPDATVEILDPALFVRGESPQRVKDVDAPADYEDVFEGSFGAANLLWLFEAPGGDTSRALTDPRGPALLWRAGAVTVFERDADTGVALRVKARSEPARLCTAMTQWYDRSFDDDHLAHPVNDGFAFTGGEQSAVVSCRGRNIGLGIAPTARIASRLARP